MSFFLHFFPFLTLNGRNSFLEAKTKPQAVANEIVNGGLGGGDVQREKEVDFLSHRQLRVSHLSLRDGLFPSIFLMGLCSQKDRRLIIRAQYRTKEEPESFE